MAGGVFSLAKLFGMTIRESATDGSDFTNPDADYRRLFLGEDGNLHLKDSSGTVTDIGGSGSVATDAIWDAKGDLAAGTGANTAAKLTVGTNQYSIVADSGQSTGLKWVPSALRGQAAWVPTIGTSPQGTVTGANLGTSGGTFAAQVFVPAMMNLRSITYRNTDTGTARSMEWGLYYDDGTTSSPRVADGTDSFTPGGAASNRTSAATSAPVTLFPGSYWIVLRNTGGATNFQVGILSSGDAMEGMIGIAQKTLGSALGSTLDLSTSWTRTSNSILPVYLRGSVFGESSAF